jgi:hypothetical protein
MYNVNNETRSCNIRCIGKAITIIYSECLFEALGNHNAKRMRKIVISALSGSTLFFHLISYTVRFSKKSYWTQNVFFDFLYNFYLKHFLFWDEMSEIWSLMYIGLREKYQLFLSDSNETLIFTTEFGKIIKYKISRKYVQW